jgi:hypothetical protein
MIAETANVTTANNVVKRRLLRVLDLRNSKKLGARDNLVRCLAVSSHGFAAAHGGKPYRQGLLHLIASKPSFEAAFSNIRYGEAQPHRNVRRRRRIIGV